MLKILLTITLLFLYNTSYGACRPVTIIAPDGTMTICQVCNDGKTIICT
jgi:hypothetical protein